MTELLYYHDSYIKNFRASVTEVEPCGKFLRIELDKTAFYPGGGGQPADKGWIIFEEQKFKISKIQRERGTIWHVFDDEDIRLEKGELVDGEIDWERRYKIMRTHSAMHILCGVVWRDYGASVTGGNMEPGKGRMDFEFETMKRELVDEIEEKCNIEVEASREIKTKFHTREEAVTIPDLIRTKVDLIPKTVQKIRTVEIVGLDLQADGGTHVSNTVEVGRIRIVDYKSKGAANKRIYLEIE